MKEIIIDDIDVSGCCHNNSDNNNGLCDIYKCRCYQIFCNYKHLKRKEKECEELKKQYNCYACGNCKGKEDYINLEKHHKGLRKQFDKYYQALQEIKNIVENGCYPEFEEILQKINEAEE